MTTPKPSTDANTTPSQRNDSAYPTNKSLTYTDSQKAPSEPCSNEPVISKDRPCIIRRIPAQRRRLHCRPHRNRPTSTHHRSAANLGRHLPIRRHNSNRRTTTPSQPPRLPARDPRGL